MSFRPVSQIDRAAFGPVGAPAGGGGWNLSGNGGGGGQMFVPIGGGGATEDYLAEWMPEARKKLISKTGMSGLGKEVAALKKQIANEKNNYARMALNSQLDNAMRRWQQEWQNQMPAYRNLARQSFRDNAQRTFAAESAAGRPTSLAAMAANSILGGNHYGYGIIDQGRLVAPAGNALEDALAAGIDPNSSLAQMLADQDVFSQEDYMPGSRPSLMNSYSSGAGFGIGGAQKVFGYDNAYGGSGRQAAIADAQGMIRDYNWANDAAKSYQQSMNNKNPLGTFKGGDVMRGPSLPGVDKNGWVPDWVPDGKYSPDQIEKTRQDWDRSQDYYSKRGVIQMQDPTKASGKGSLVSNPGGSSDYDPYRFQMSNGGMVQNSDGPDPNGWIEGDSTGGRNPQSGAHVPTRDEMRKEFWNDSAYWNDMIGGNYMPQKGGIADYHQGAKERLADFRAQGSRSYSLPAYPAAMGIADVKPNIQKSAKPFGGTLSPEWTSNDQFTAPLFSSRGGGVRNNYAVPSSASASSFDRYAMGPMEVGAMYASAPFASSPAPRSIQPFSRLNR